MHRSGLLSCLDTRSDLGRWVLFWGVHRYCHVASVFAFLSWGGSAKDFIQHLMEKDPEKRFTCEQALQHPW